MEQQTDLNKQCAVAIIGNLNSDALFDLTRQSIDAAFKNNPGEFTNLRYLEPMILSESLTFSQALLKTSREANDKKCPWVFLVIAGDLLTQIVFSEGSSFTGEYDIISGRGYRYYPQHLQLGSEQRLKIYLADPLLVHQTGVFISTSTLSQAPKTFYDSINNDFDFILRLIAEHKSIRLSVPFCATRWHADFDNRSSSITQQRLRQVQQAADAYFSNHEYLVSNIQFKERKIKFAINNPLDLIQKYHFGGLFWEERELAELAKAIKPGAVIVDVGSHIGNHAIFYEKFLQPKKLILIEPNEDSIKLLQKNLEINNISLQDITLYQAAIGAKKGFARLSQQNQNTGASSIKINNSGDIEVFPLDELIQEKIDFIKIDVEGMEFDVLDGAKNIIKLYQPKIYIEIKKENIERFKSYIEDLKYKVVGEFPNPIETNFLIAPQ